ncbi:LADA_0E01266g1_1 [Lachancea dasiensis]|uniref:LADA_0E01266g1_1 n=1 Tax=Lachancea dasiensis TaxID=1072105 RepID=A0A1G4JA84_9SACH|nr:LADA_0E01266g1_1 [Lachancea dasiensis]
MGIFTGDDNKELEKYNDDLVSSSLTERLNDSFLSMGDSISSIWKEAVNHVESPISDLWMNASGSMGDLLGGLGFPGGFGHPTRILRLMEDSTTQEGVTGLYGYRTPSDKQFMECHELKGLSVWDSRGWWRCLFPENIVRARMSPEQLKNVLTRERVERDKNHSLGLFFTEYSAYLMWRANIVKQVEKRRASLVPSASHEESSQGLWNTPEDLMDHTTGKSVVGTSTYVTYNSTPDGLEKVKETKTFFNDGSSKLRYDKQGTGPDGQKHFDSYEKMIPSSYVHDADAYDGADHPKDGWFWHK